MKKLFLAIILVLSLAAVFTLAVSAGSIEVVDDGTVDITLGECVIDGLDTEIPEPSRGFTYLLDTDTQTAKITAWANYKDKELGAKFVTPSTIIYDGVSYTVNAFSRVVYATSNGTSSTSNSNYVLTHVYVSDEITAIPKEAFAECRALEYVYVGKNVETIGAKSFYYAGFTAGSYYVTVEETTTDPESGEEITTTVTKRIEEAGGQMGGIKAFIWKTQK